jgi:formylglycine-generating enzyme
VQKLNVSKQDVAAKVTMPVLTIHGKKDRNAPYGAGREWAQFLPDARLITLENAAHNSWADEPELIVRAIDTFLAGKWPPEAEKISAADKTDIEHKLARLTFAPVFIEMQGGTFTLGDANGAAAERPARTVQLSPFWISATEITRQHFEAFVSDTGYKTEPEQPENSGGWVRPPGEKEMVRKSDASWRNPYFETDTTQPITFITSIDAIAYADWLASKTGLAIKLPTEAQWEFACKSGQQQTVLAETSGVSKPQPAQSSAQLTNLRGNVWEWTRDFYSDYSAASAIDLEQPKDLGRGRVIRGGSYAFPASMATCTYRTEGHGSHARAQDLGFRLVIESSK